MPPPNTALLVSSKGERILPKDGEVPRYNRFHNLWCVVGYRWVEAHGRWAGACRTHTSTAEFQAGLFAFVFMLAL